MYRGDTRLRTEEHTSPARMAILEMASEPNVTMAKYIGDHPTGELSTGREPWVNRVPQLTTVLYRLAAILIFTNTCGINVYEEAGLWAFDTTREYIRYTAME